MKLDNVLDRTNNKVVTGYIEDHPVTLSIKIDKVNTRDVDTTFYEGVVTSVLGDKDVNHVAKHGDRVDIEIDHNGKVVWLKEIHKKWSLDIRRVSKYPMTKAKPLANKQHNLDF